ERKPDDGGDRRERDVALGKVQAKPEDLAALPRAAAYDSSVGNRGGIRARARAGEREARDFLPARQSRQVIVLLLLSAVVVEQLGGPERVGDGHSRGGGRAAARDLGEHAGVRVGRELQAAILLRNDHRKEALRFE